MTSCEECEKVHLQELKKLPDCEICKRPSVLPQNYEALQVYSLCKSQLIVGMAGIVGVKLEAVKVAMDLLDVDDQLTVAEKVLAFADELFKREA